MSHTQIERQFKVTENMSGEMQVVPYECLKDFQKLSNDHIQDLKNVAETQKKTVEEERLNASRLREQVSDLHDENKHLRDILFQKEQQLFDLCQEKSKLEEEKRINQSFLDMKKVLELHPEVFYKLKTIIEELKFSPKDSKTIMLRNSTNIMKRKRTFRNKKDNDAGDDVGVSDETGDAGDDVDAAGGPLDETGDADEGVDGKTGYTGKGLGKGQKKIWDTIFNQKKTQRFKTTVQSQSVPSKRTLSKTPPPPIKFAVGGDEQASKRRC